MTTVPPLALLFANAPQEAGSSGVRTLGDFLRSGGELMIPLGICSVLVLGFFLERTLALRRARVCPLGWLGQGGEGGEGTAQAVIGRCLLCGVLSCICVLLNGSRFYPEAMRGCNRSPYFSYRNSEK